MPVDADQLNDSGLPIFFAIGNAAELDLPLPANRHGQSIRVWARSLTEMQKEAIVLSVQSGAAWRLASDEGPYLNGFDAAPCPLSFLTTGMVAAYMNELLALADRRGLAVNDVTLVQDNFYSMEGSALEGTMTGGALPAELEVRIDADASDEALEDLVADAVAASPLTALMRGEHRSRFTLTLNGEPVGVERVAVIDTPPPANPAGYFSAIRPAATQFADPIRRVAKVDAQPGVEGGAGSSLKATQSRTLHLRGTCRRLADGSKEVIQELFRPIGSTWRHVTDEAPGFGGSGLAPDAMSYAAAGIAFCFMTQLGRYAKIARKHLGAYDVVQDTHFSPGSASSGSGKPVVTDPVETHVYLESNEGERFARGALAMGEQTCFLHAFCRTALETRYTIARS